MGVCSGWQCEWSGRLRESALQAALPLLYGDEVAGARRDSRPQSNEGRETPCTKCVMRGCPRFISSRDTAARPLVYSQMSCVTWGLSGVAAHVVSCTRVGVEDASAWPRDAAAWPLMVGAYREACARLFTHWSQRRVRSGCLVRSRGIVCRVSVNSSCVRATQRRGRSCTHICHVCCRGSAAVPLMWWHA